LTSPTAFRESGRDLCDEVPAALGVDFVRNLPMIKLSHEGSQKIDGE
jgi:hypothetical protein